MGMYPVGTNYMSMASMPYSMGGMAGGFGAQNQIFQMMLMEQQQQMMETKRKFEQAKQARETAAQAGTTPQAGPNAQPAQEMPTLGFKEVHDMANAGVALPTATQAAQKSAMKYRQSEEFGKLLTEYKAQMGTDLEQKISALQEQKTKLDKLNAELKNVTSDNPVKEYEEVVEPKYKNAKKKIRKKHTKLVEKPLRKAKDVKSELKTKEYEYGKESVAVQKEMIKAQKAKLAATNREIRAAQKALRAAKKAKEATQISLCKENLANLKASKSAIKGDIKALKFKGNGAKWFGRAGWAVAIGVEAWDVKKVADKHGWASKQTAKKTTSAVAGLAGACGGAKLGAIAGAKIGFLIGSIFPGAGNAIGAGIGGFLGGLIGGAIGYWGAQKTADAAFDATMGKTEYKA